MVKKKKSVQEATAMAESRAVEDAMSVSKMRASLKEIKKFDGVIGYILRNSTSAAIDIKDSTKIMDYAVLSSSAFDAGEEFSELFDLGGIENIVIEGKDVKVLSLTINENNISIFMEKNADCNKILRKLREL